MQFVTGVALAMYYVPTPLLAYDSVRFITDTLTLGWLLRGLHFWGASFIVIAAVVHMLRVFFYGSYKAPREVTWLSGVVMLLLILAFSLSGYLLPWDQKAYWATTVTINIARRHAGRRRTGRRRAARRHAARRADARAAGTRRTCSCCRPRSCVFVVAHIALMRRHGISGPLTPQEGPPTPFYPVARRSRTRW